MTERFGDNSIGGETSREVFSDFARVLQELADEFPDDMDKQALESFDRIVAIYLADPLGSRKLFLAQRMFAAVVDEVDDRIALAQTQDSLRGVFGDSNYS